MLGRESGARPSRRKGPRGVAGNPAVSKGMIPVTTRKPGLRPLSLNWRRQWQKQESGRGGDEGGTSGTFISGLTAGKGENHRIKADAPPAADGSAPGGVVRGGRQTALFGGKEEVVDPAKGAQKTKGVFSGFSPHKIAAGGVGHASSQNVLPGRSDEYMLCLHILLSSNFHANNSWQKDPRPADKLRRTRKETLQGAFPPRPSSLHRSHPWR